jgi:hypothetical protein
VEAATVLVLTVLQGPAGAGHLRWADRHALQQQQCEGRAMYGCGKVSRRCRSPPGRSGARPNQLTSRRLQPAPPKTEHVGGIREASEAAPSTVASCIAASGFRPEPIA